MKDLKKKKDSDLLKELKELREKIKNMRFSVSGSQSKDSFERRKIRKSIARILTELNIRNKK